MHTKNALLLKADHIYLKYGDKQILRDVNFEIFDIKREGLAQGQVVSLIGRSGIGKTQLFKVLSGLINPTSGNVLIGVDQRPVKAGDVGIVHQNYILFNHRTIYSNLKIGLDHSDSKYTDAQKEKIINDYSAEFELQEHLKKFPTQLSGGQRQRVSILQQILTGNKFILLDEPFSGLDVLMKDKVIDLLLKVSTINEENTLIIVSHDIESSFAISDTAFILSNTDGKAGSTITDVIDLIEMGFAWQKDIKKEKAFQDLVYQMKFKL